MAEQAQEKCAMCNGVCLQADKGFYPRIVTDNGRLFLVMQMCKREGVRRAAAAQNEVLRLSNLPARFVGKSWKDYRPSKGNSAAITAAKRMLAGDCKGIYLFGKTGCGKTYLAAIVAQERLKQKGGGVVFASMPDILADIRASYDSGNTAAVLETVINAPLLVLDDVGAERMTEWVGEQFFMLINRRDADGMQTIVTSNYAPDALAERLAFKDARGKLDKMQGDRIVSRLFGMCEVIGMGGADYRLGAR